ncbi:2-oxoacid:acceptor oxidoreductase subunit alpha [Kaustia mangrovi]|uniref:2-oxoacid:acceptor oxidoreductase subunit alpha n=1 Tax=Kaustia mangrovi TaxID=2593653 RepID=A0A7S8HAR1_9HYPH|nr:2-oxoacid:acceptor oxidoreductase subunit alpha [Kaustia mangrovi]QPC41699.1 2-oxoacid:acceptor oxidoreductase subunit alpha [Kaustia mangrovi]
MNEHVATAPADDELEVSLVPEADFARVRFAGDSGDGIQLTGTRFAASAARFGNDLATFPDYPAEIRAPQGTLYGVSAYSLNIGRTEVLTFGDVSDVLVALNPAALKTNLADLKDGGLLIVDESAFIDRNLAKAGYEANPLQDDSLGRYRVLPIDITTRTLDAVAETGLGRKDATRCKNMWTLGLVLWLFERDTDAVADWLQRKFYKTPEVLAANLAALKAGHAWGETAELPPEMRRYHIPKAKLKTGEYRTVTGNETLAWGLYAGARLAGLDLFFGSYPITPASPLLHALSRMKNRGVITFQAEDEIAAVCSAIGASYAGSLGVTASAGPGIALKTEAIGLAISTELPLVVVDVQRGGPSTGLPTKTEQSDLFQAVYGRNGDAPVPVIAASRSSDCFDCAIEAVKIATRYMTPVMLLSDGYIANSAEPWPLPDPSKFAPFPVSFRTDADGFEPFARDPETLARAWAVPGTPGLEHRIGGLEKADITGNVSYDPDNHEHMTRLRVDKIRGIADALPEQRPEVGKPHGRLAVVGWGSTWGATRVAVRRAMAEGIDVAQIHLRHIWPLPKNLGDLLGAYDKILIPELNTGQLAALLRAELGIRPHTLNKVKGQPFKVSEIGAAIRELAAD